MPIELAAVAEGCSSSRRGGGSPVTLTGPEGSVALSRDDPASSAAALVLDATTRRIRAILHGLPEQTVAARQPLLKNRYDPSNLFRLNQNILPATQRAASDQL